MKCNHCGIEYHENKKYVHGHRSVKNELDYVLESSICPACRESNIYIIEGNANVQMTPDGQRLGVEEINWRRLVHPAVELAQSLPKEVPEDFRVQFSEAQSIINLSPRSAAALARRLLEAILVTQGASRSKNLFEQIKWCVDSGIPSYIGDHLDNVRQIGKFAAHFKENISTGEIIEVDQGEAEFVLSCIANLCDFYYVYPVKAKERSDAVQVKLDSLKS